MPGSFTVSQFQQWDSAIGPTTPKKASATELSEARIISGVALHTASDGIMLRMSDETGAIIDIRLNAAVALRLADSIPGAAMMAGWLDPDGTVNALPDRPTRGR